MELSNKDLEFLKEKGISVEKLEAQLKRFSDGFPYLKLAGPAVPGNGIIVLAPETEKRCVVIWDRYLGEGAKVVKMVPASGAASRMFKDLFAFLNGKSDRPDNDFVKKFFDEIENFAFFNTLNQTVLELYGKSVDTLIGEKKYKEIVRALLESEGMNYGNLPKALLQFHKVLGSSRTALEEHLSEGAQYASGKKDRVRVHFTVSPEHRPLMERKIEEVSGLLGKRYGVELDISLSEQKPSTDTIAVTLDNKPYRDEETLFFRPGGHGALIENLNDLDADVVFVKNIDNVVPDSRREVSNHFKQVIAGLLVTLKQKADEYCRILKKGHPSEKDMTNIFKFLKDVLYVRNEHIDSLDEKEKMAFAFLKLNRPMRVCGMVKNEGEPGGGPFIVIDPDGTTSLQILESTQIDHEDKEAMEMLKGSTHFNPVDLVCAIKDFQGKKFNLLDYVDESTGFISSKSVKGTEIKALELPGLWNGAMSNWNTIFVEVPAETFNPVKTVNDLLRKSHQSK